MSEEALLRELNILADVNPKEQAEELKNRSNELKAKIKAIGKDGDKKVAMRYMKEFKEA